MQTTEKKVVYYEDWSKSVGRFSVEVELANPEDMMLARRGMLRPDQVRRVTMSGLVDIGASCLVIPARIVEQLGLEPGKAEVSVRFANGERASRQTVSNVYVKVQGRDGYVDAIVEPGREDPIIGAFPLEVFDFLVDARNQKLVPRDPRFIVAEIESVC